MKDLKANSITITYLSKISFGSPNGADKEIDNINPIKKIKMQDNTELPYISSQSIRRALRDKLEELGWDVDKIVDTQSKSKSEGDGSEERNKKAPVKTEMDIEKYIGDDLFGFMDAKSGKKRTSPVRVESLVSFHPFKENLDYGTNFQGAKIGKEGGNIFETEIHSGIYRGSILIELDRIGEYKHGKTEVSLEPQQKADRVKALLSTFKMLWKAGRQTRFLDDPSPKFIAAAFMKSKNAIFLESVKITKDNEIDFAPLKSVVNDYEEFIESSVFAVQEAVFQKPSGDNKLEVKTLGDGFKEISNWVDKYYGVKSEK